MDFKRRPTPQRSTVRPPTRPNTSTLSTPRPSTSTPPHDKPIEKKVVKTVEIKLTMPKIRGVSIHDIVSKIDIKRRLRFFTVKRTALIIIVVGVSITGYNMYHQLANRPIAVTQHLGDGVTSTKVIEKPDYNTALPSGKTIDQLGGWTRVSPPNSNPVFAYVDTIGKIPINVSQQPLPKEFGSDSAKAVETLAKSFNAKDKVSVGDTDAYIGTSAKGPQSVVLTKKNLLILIRSSVKIEDVEWGKYVNSLQ